MVRPITKDTVVCMSLSGRPSNVGTRFHNFLFTGALGVFFGIAGAGLGSRLRIV